MRSSCIIDNKLDKENIECLHTFKKPEHLWSIILAGGNGDRVSALVERWKGRPIPKQYCAFVGRRSMLQHTLARADVLGKREHQLTLIARDHQNEAQLQLADHWPGRVIIQPVNRDTLPGILLPLTHVYARDSKATVVIYPSDHFIYPESRFKRVILSAVQAVKERPHMLVLLSALAEGIELDYGWICPGRKIWESGESIMYSVNRFLEKPSHADAVSAMESSGMCNTLIIVVKAQNLWRLGWSYFPEIMKHFERLHHAIGTTRENDVLEEIYDVMPSQNFSTGLLTLADKRIGVMPMAGVLWSDWGREKRIVETLKRIGKQPNFPTIPLVGNRQVPQMAEQTSPLYKSVNF
jgi:mannose-1-phosphate guanylyltransferase